MNACELIQTVGARVADRRACWRWKRVINMLQTAVEWRLKVTES
jgi:hypothetical protein